MVSVSGTLEGQAFTATLEPDGEGSHWFKVPRALHEAASAGAGTTVAVVLVPVHKQPEPKLRADLKQALAASPAATVQWKAITPAARRDFIQWIATAKQAQTRERRIRSGCDMLEAGKKAHLLFRSFRDVQPRQHRRAGGNGVRVNFAPLPVDRSKGLCRETSL